MFDVEDIRCHHAPCDRRVFDLIVEQSDVILYITLGSWKNGICGVSSCLGEILVLLRDPSKSPSTCP